MSEMRISGGIYYLRSDTEHTFEFDFETGEVFVDEEPLERGEVREWFDDDISYENITARVIHEFDWQPNFSYLFKWIKKYRNPEGVLNFQKILDFFYEVFERFDMEEIDETYGFGTFIEIMISVLGNLRYDLEMFQDALESNCIIYVDPEELENIQYDVGGEEKHVIGYKIIHDYFDIKEYDGESLKNALETFYGYGNIDRVIYILDWEFVGNAISNLLEMYYDELINEAEDEGDEEAVKDYEEAKDEINTMFDRDIINYYLEEFGEGSFLDFLSELYESSGDEIFELDSYDLIGEVFWDITSSNGMVIVLC